MPTMKELWGDLKAWRRGEKRVAPYDTRGRIYQRKGESVGGPSLYRSKATPDATLKLKITRADGTVEYREAPVIAKEI